MKIQKVITIVLILSSLGFIHPKDNMICIDYNKNNVVYKEYRNKMTNIHDTTNFEIYEFMKVLITDQKLQLNYGIHIQPEQNCDINQNDSIFLNTLLYEDNKINKDTSDMNEISISFQELPKCLINVDIQEMLLQKKHLKKFKWDNSRLGFNEKNEEEWYSFSIPLFSKDKNIVLMKIERLCRGLCGYGCTVEYIKQNNKWTSKKTMGWLH